MFVSPTPLLYHRAPSFAFRYHPAPPAPQFPLTKLEWTKVSGTYFKNSIRSVRRMPNGIPNIAVSLGIVLVRIAGWSAPFQVLLVKLDEEHDPICVTQCSRRMALSCQIFGQEDSARFTDNFLSAA